MSQQLDSQQRCFLWQQRNMCFSLWNNRGRQQGSQQLSQQLGSQPHEGSAAQQLGSAVQPHEGSAAAQQLGSSAQPHEGSQQSLQQLPQPWPW